jgi:hypothetical protein
MGLGRECCPSGSSRFPTQARSVIIEVTMNGQIVSNVPHDFPVELCQEEV